MTWPLEDAGRVGLLPDFIWLKSQNRDGPAINPGTTQAHIPELFDAGAIYDIRRLPMHDCFIHAPCAIRNVTEDNSGVSFTVDGWGATPDTEPYYVLVSGWEGPTPYVTSPNGSTIQRAFVAGGELLIIHTNGPTRIQIAKRGQ